MWAPDPGCFYLEHVTCLFYPQPEVYRVSVGIRGLNIFKNPSTSIAHSELLQNVISTVPAAANMDVYNLYN